MRENRQQYVDDLEMFWNNPLATLWISMYYITRGLKNIKIKIHQGMKYK